MRLMPCAAVGADETAFVVVGFLNRAKPHARLNGFNNPKLSPWALLPNGFRRPGWGGLKETVWRKNQQNRLSFL